MATVNQIVYHGMNRLICDIFGIWNFYVKDNVSLLAYARLLEIGVYRSFITESGLVS